MFFGGRIHGTQWDAAAYAMVPSSSCPLPTTFSVAVLMAGNGCQARA